MDDKKELATVDPQGRAPDVFSDSHNFETAQRMARALAESDIVPAQYKGKLANCLVALEIAHRTRNSVLTVMQNLNIIHGRPAWSSQYIVSSINSCRRFTPLRYRLENLGEKTVGSTKINDQRCVAYATDLKTGEVVEGPPVTIEMSVREGWFNKSGSKWQTMPEVMIRYRAASFFGRLNCPDVLLGMQSDDELRDVSHDKPPSAETLNEKIRARQVANEVEGEIEN